ncbi:Laminin subunit beta-4 [Coniochaeta hoffmannii]|uniref:Laminin subunit beta-4 n=1 Tax=Coniochaeta hoffmannii TaxID=91930 RepID=A0AA38RCV6_9PEZI|nr:Laminin subunit beta-4 [Coniochaeta hoffmannii]
MAWDSKSGRRRQNSSATAPGSRNIALHTRQQSRQVPKGPKSQHLTDPFLHDFLASSFDPAEYLNSILPPLQTSPPSSAASRSGQGAVSLAELSTQAQTTLSQLNAHTTRLTNTLTQLTDDILRSGSRLAYEVELLRGETLSLAETLTEGLHDDIQKFVPGGLQNPASQRRYSLSASDGQDSQRRLSILQPAVEPPPEGPSETAAPDEPPYITQLRTLTLVRSRLDSVIKTFGEAMEFVFPPSELSVGSSFLSVSAPDPGPESHSTEEKGQQVLQKLRDEISGLLSNNDDPIKGIEEAARRIEELKELNLVWKGTAEEKGRTRFIESLARMVEVKHQELLREVEQAARRDGRKGEAVNNSKPENEAQVTESRGYGLMSQLQKLRSGLDI